MFFMHHESVYYAVSLHSVHYKCNIIQVVTCEHFGKLFIIMSNRNIILFLILWCSMIHIAYAFTEGNINYLTYPIGLTLNMILFHIFTFIQYFTLIIKMQSKKSYQNVSRAFSLIKILVFFFTYFDLFHVQILFLQFYWNINIKKQYYISQL